MRKIAMMILTAMIMVTLHSAPKAELWNYWDNENNEDSRTINHGSFQYFLDMYRVKDNDTEMAKIRYAAVTQEDRLLLDKYIEELSRLDILEYNRKEQFAYWVNLYNSLTIALILDNYPVKSIRNISRPWDQKIIRINDQDLSLNDIEHRILRPRWKDPRIHFVVNCASIGCPDLPALALTAENSQEILEESTQIYLNHPRGISLEQGKLKLSAIFDWFADDFGKNEKSLMDFLSNYYDFSEIERTSGKSRFNLKLTYHYDWDLNSYE